jgi:hypothetical protein
MLRTSWGTTFLVDIVGALHKQKKGFPIYISISSGQTSDPTWHVWTVQNRPLITDVHATSFPGYPGTEVEVHAVLKSALWVWIEQKINYRILFAADKSDLTIRFLLFLGTRLHDNLQC